jgi:UDP-N-acetylglucosamine 2-epimerase (non-hydrolysing)
VRVVVALGTRPEIIKLAPVINELVLRGVGVQVVATGQHYDVSLTDTFFEGLRVTPTVRWQLTGTASERVGSMLQHAIDLIAEERPDLVVLLGDTNTVPLFCLASRRACVPVAHLEAGLRSFNPTSLEEVNRKVAGALASLHFAPTDLAAEFLHREGVDERRIHVVGNPIIDVLRLTGLTRAPVADRAGVVVTAHRASNVDDPARLLKLVRLIQSLAETTGPVRFPVHPRTRQRLEQSGFMRELGSEDVELMEPLPWHAMLSLLRMSRLVVTDSGGLQEEASFFGVPVVVLRTTTPRWEGVKAGTSILCGLDGEAALDAVRALTRTDAQERIASAPCPYGDGFTSGRVADVLMAPTSRPLLVLDEPLLASQLPLWDGPVRTLW